MTKFRTQFKNWGRIGHSFGDAKTHMTVQSAASENDLNQIVKRMKQGLDPGVGISEARYGLSITSQMKEDSMQRVAEAKSQFEALSPEERGDTKSFAEYLESKLKSKLTQEGGTVDSLDVTVPTDSKSVSSTQKKKGSSSETKTANKSAGEKNIQKGDESPPEE